MHAVQHGILELQAGSWELYALLREPPAVPCAYAKFNPSCLCWLAELLPSCCVACLPAALLLQNSQGASAAALRLVLLLLLMHDASPAKIGSLGSLTTDTPTSAAAPFYWRHSCNPPPAKPIPTPAKLLP